MSKTATTWKVFSSLGMITFRVAVFGLLVGLLQEQQKSNYRLESNTLRAGDRLDQISMNTMVGEDYLLGMRRLAWMQSQDLYSIGEELQVLRKCALDGPSPRLRLREKTLDKLRLQSLDRYNDWHWGVEKWEFLLTERVKDPRSLNRLGMEIEQRDRIDESRKAKYEVFRPRLKGEEETPAIPIYGDPPLP